MTQETLSWSLVALSVTGSWRANSETGLHSNCAVRFLSVHSRAQLFPLAFLLLLSEEDTIKVLFAAGWILEIAEGNRLLPDYCVLPACGSFLLNRSNLSFHRGTDSCASSILCLIEAVSTGRKKKGVSR